jgi:hypothetical protein
MIIKTVLNVFNNFAIENNINFENNNELEIITDFEKASINAINDVFPFVTHSACFFLFLSKYLASYSKRRVIYKVHGRFSGRPGI